MEHIVAEEREEERPDGDRVTDRISDIHARLRRRGNASCDASEYVPYERAQYDTDGGALNMHTVKVNVRMERRKKNARDGGVDGHEELWIVTMTM